MIHCDKNEYLKKIRQSLHQIYIYIFVIFKLENVVGTLGDSPVTLVEITYFL